MATQAPVYVAQSTYLTSEGDTLAAICFRHYGIANARVLNAVLARNRWLTRLGVRLPSSRAIVLPDLVLKEADVRKFLLWEPKVGEASTAVLKRVDKTKRYEVNEDKLALALAAYRARKKVPFPEEDPPPYSSYHYQGPLIDPYGTAFGQDALYVFV